MIDITTTCICGKSLMVKAETAEIVLAKFRQNGWVTSTEDLRTFYREGHFPPMRCSTTCWIDHEYTWAVNQPMRRRFCQRMKQRYDRMQDHESWSMLIWPLKEMVEAIKIARPGTKEKRLAKRRIVSR